MKTHLSLDLGLGWRLCQPFWASLHSGGPVCCLSLGRPTHPISSISPGTNHPSPTQEWDQGVLVGMKSTRGATQRPELQDLSPQNSATENQAGKRGPRDTYEGLVVPRARALKEWIVTFRKTQALPTPHHRQSKNAPPAALFRWWLREEGR